MAREDRRGHPRRYRRHDAFPQRAAAWLLRPASRAWSIAIYLIVIVAVIVGLVEMTGLTNRVRGDERAQQSNRAQNVLTWCGAIDSLDRALQAYIGLFPQVPALPLPKLRCHELARRTLSSSTPTHSTR